jgi:membrane-associated protease RseP (regulator of RpoE activity)
MTCLARRIRMNKPLIGFGIALAVLAACFLAVLGGGMAGGIVGYLGGRQAARAALPRLWEELAPPQEHWEGEWPQVPAPWEWAPEQIPGPLSAQLRGILVTEVVPGGPADEAGVEKGDVIIALDNRAFDQRQGLSELIRERDPEDEVVLTVVRPGEEIEVFEIDVTLGSNRDDEGNMVAYLGVFYRNIGAGIRIVPHTRDPWD